jgi:hypothetical protein
MMVLPPWGRAAAPSTMPTQFVPPLGLFWSQVTPNKNRDIPTPPPSAQRLIRSRVCGILPRAGKAEKWQQHLPFKAGSKLAVVVWTPSLTPWVITTRTTSVLGLPCSQCPASSLTVWHHCGLQWMKPTLYMGSSVRHLPYQARDHRGNAEAVHAYQSAADLVVIAISNANDEGGRARIAPVSPCKFHSDGDGSCADCQPVGRQEGHPSCFINEPHRSRWTSATKLPYWGKPLSVEGRGKGWYCLWHL